MQYLRSSDGNSAAVRLGSGPDLVILHSLLADWRAFEAVLPELAKRYRVTVLNLPGFHGVPPIAGELSAYVDWIDAALDAFGVHEPAALMGNGFGGTLCLAFALDRPARVSRLIVVDAAPGFPEAGREAFRNMARSVAASGMGSIADVAAKRVLSPARLERDPGAVEDRRRALEEVDPEGFRAACDILVSVDLVPRLPELSMPLFVIYGEHDQATPPALNRLIVSTVPGAREQVVGDCGHCPPLEAPDVFLDILFKEIDRDAIVDA